MRGTRGMRDVRSTRYEVHEGYKGYEQYERYSCDVKIDLLRSLPFVRFFIYNLMIRQLF